MVLKSNPRKKRNTPQNPTHTKRNKWKYKFQNTKGTKCKLYFF